MPKKFHKPVILGCVPPQGIPTTQKCRIYMDTEMTLVVVKAFLAKVGIAQWVVEDLSWSERNQCGAPEKAVIVSIPLIHKNRFYREFENEFYAPSSAQAVPDSAQAASA